jgi:hypothetical protein
MPTQRTARAKNDGPESLRLRTVSSINGTAVALSLSSNVEVGQSRLIREDQTFAVHFPLTHPLMKSPNSG